MALGKSIFSVENGKGLDLGVELGLGGLCSLKWHIMLLAVLEILPNYANFMPEFPNYDLDFRNYAHKMT